MPKKIDEQDVWITAGLIKNYGALNVWEALKENYPIAYDMLLLASLEMQAKELEKLKGQ